MTTDDAIFDAIADERRTLAATLATLTPEQWQTPSLCAGWTVRDVAAHVTLPLVVPKWRFGLAMLRARGSFDRANLAMTSHVVSTYGDRLPETITERAARQFTPPGFGAPTPLTDIIVHGQDIRRPLAIDYRPADGRQCIVLDFLTSPKAHGHFRAVDADVRWVATDLDWQHGDGPEVRGPGLSLMLLLTGRLVALGDTSGPGTDLIR
ncbi:maleylpyruvate isomerase family mycothiol-dependent enzyme [Gordonia sp. CPCC 205515]|uniref:maleylpyruvate isomerase family mycothiol-dependent enzyme n=1 Tax=Gordonia sp. CPCC 205515 TaxID=3140791 RepID=UPI003AF3640C